MFVFYTYIRILSRLCPSVFVSDYQEFLFTFRYPFRSLYPVFSPHVTPVQFNLLLFSVITIPASSNISRISLLVLHLYSPVFWSLFRPNIYYTHHLSNAAKGFPSILAIALVWHALNATRRIITLYSNDSNLTDTGLNLIIVFQALKQYLTACILALISVCLFPRAFVSTHKYLNLSFQTPWLLPAYASVKEFPMIVSWISSYLYSQTYMFI